MSMSVQVIDPEPAETEDPEATVITQPETAYELTDTQLMAAHLVAQKRLSYEKIELWSARTTVVRQNAMCYTGAAAC